MQLYNKLNADERSALIDKAGEDRITMSFYKYNKIENPQLFRDKLFLDWNALDVLGRIYVSYEGINAQLSVPSQKLLELKSQIDSIDFLKNIRLNVAIEQNSKSFLKLKIKVRDKIVADGLDHNSLDVKNIGVHLKAKEFNKILDRPETICVDVRNHYESEIGHFKGAITPNADTFKEALNIIEEQLEDELKDKNLLMYCTGGIRCEKASAYYKNKGFKNVFQLEGGIIQYARQVKKEGLENKFLGKNFVFDNRRAEKISEDIIARCHQCGNLCDTHTNCSNEACNLLFIQCGDCSDNTKNTCSVDCQEIVNLPYEKQKALRKGKKASNRIFKKGRSKSLKFKVNNK